MKKSQKIAAVCVAVLLIVGLGFIANAFAGNPLSAALARRTAERYMEENHGGGDFVLGSVNYSFKDGGYYAFVTSPGSEDSHFILYLDMLGRLKWDTWEDVTSGANTAGRLDEEYRALTAQVADSPEFPCTSEIAFGELVFGDREWGRGDPYGLEQSSLKLDGDYDVAALGAEAGRFVLYADDEEVSVERAAELLLEVRRVMEESGVPFRSVDFVLRCPRVEAGGPRTGEESIHVLNFPWEEIREEGMKERVQAAYEESMAYYAREDAKKQAG